MPMPTSSSRKNDRHRKTEHRKLWKKVYSLEYRVNNLEKTKVIERKSSLQRHNEILKEIFDILGRECSNPDCPIPKEKMNPIALQIDHVNNDGAKDRKVYGVKATSNQYYRRILKKLKEGSKDYQTLCAYCNWVKGYEQRRSRRLK